MDPVRLGHNQAEGSELSDWVRSRCQRLLLNLDDYTITRDKKTGEVVATPKDIDVEVKEV